MIKNILKIVFLGIIGFAGLVYLTAPEDKLNPKKVDLKTLSLSTFPSHFEIIGNSNYVKKEELFKDASYLIVLNHDALAVLNELDKYTNKNIVLVANISQTPWLIKKLAVGGKLEELYKTSKLKLINDESGAVVKALALNDIKQNRYFVYKISNKNLNQSFIAEVPLNSLEKGISKEQKETSLKELVKKL